MEYFDVLDCNGEITGKILPKDAELGDNEFDSGVHAYIYNSKGEFLLQKRVMTKTFLPGAWDIHMGHVISGESSNEAIKREIKEEIGVELSDIRFLKRIRWDKYNHFIDLYFAKADIDICDIKLQANEVDEVGYFSMEEMIEMVKNMDYRPREYRECVLYNIDLIER